MVATLLDYGAQLNGSGAPVLAAEKGNLEIVKRLKARGANVDEMGIATYDRRSLQKQGSPLHKAAENGHIAVVDVLIQAECDRTLKDAKGRTAADIAVQSELDGAVLARLN